MLQTIKSKDDLDKLFGFVFSPVDDAALAKMITAGNIIAALNSAEVDIQKLSAAINAIDDQDHRDDFRRKAASVLAELGSWHAAQVVARESELLIEKADTLIHLAKKLIELDREQDAMRLLEEIKTTALEKEGENFWLWQRIKLLDETARMLFELDQKQAAGNLWRKAISLAQVNPLTHDEIIALRNMLVGLESLNQSDLVEEMKVLGL